ncbi:transmembrane protein 18-like isoform X2 [Pollicipes pollicipes]|uniref:transmembrane protein 18-like isoform X2 n=1 Tax=Pollicipes pollicipes TaxID=41117 RepID=UPI0018852CFB|nr:transmembrane protein 18-like isoform X2 [Pollicipes pollicipes]
MHPGAAPPQFCAQGVDWTERWIVALLVFHVTMFAVAVLARRRLNMQFAIFVILLSLVYFSEDINTFAAQNWRAFSNQQYFDSQGMFVSIVFSMPILLNCLLIVCNWLWRTNGALSQVMRQDLTNKRRESSAKKDE